MATATRPAFDSLYNVALAHTGYFTTAQAASTGYSPQALHKHVLAGRIIRVRHGIYRLVHFPAGDQEQLAVLDLWVCGQGTFSHETALAAHGLSDVMPETLHMTLPPPWRHRRLRVPAGLCLHFADVSADDKAWLGVVQITRVARTLMDCVNSGVRPDLVRSAYEQAKQRGLLNQQELVAVARAVRRPDRVCAVSPGGTLGYSPRQTRTMRPVAT